MEFSVKVSVVLTAILLSVSFVSGIPVKLQMSVIHLCVVLAAVSSSSSQTEVDFGEDLAPVYIYICDNGE